MTTRTYARWRAPSAFHAAVLIAGLTIVTHGAGQTPTPAPEAGVTLQQRVTALGQQIHWRYAGDLVTRLEQRRRVEQVLREWNGVESPTTQDRQRLIAWLDAATRATMPGAGGRLPVAPRFVGARRAESITAGSRSKYEPSRHGVAKPAADTDAAAPRSEWSRHPAAAPLEWVDPFTDDSETPAEEGDLGAQERRALKPVIADRREIAIDLAKLTSRLRGYNLELRDVSRRLALPDASDTESLRRTVERLRRLEAERRLLSLYKQGLSEEQRLVLPPSPSAELAFELARREADARLASLPGHRAAEREELERIRERLAIR